MENNNVFFVLHTITLNICLVCYYLVYVHSKKGLLCMKSAPYLHQKSAHWALNMFFFMLFVQNSILKGAVSALFYYDAKFAQNIMQNYPK